MKLTPFAESGVPIERQQKILDHLSANITSSFVFSGPPGVGKTTVMNEMMKTLRTTHWKNYGIYSKTAMQYQRDVTAAANGKIVSGLVDPNDLDSLAAQKISFAFFLDDVDKLRGTEFIRLQFFELINEVTKQRSPLTQLVMTTNMNKQEFTSFFGDAIAWRVLKHCVWVSMERSA